MLLIEDECEVEALPPDAANTPLADRVRFRCLIVCLQFLNTGAPVDRCEVLAVLVVAVVNEVLGAVAPGSSFRELLGNPGIGRGARHR